MRVLIDARKLTDGGIGDYIAGLVTGLVDAGVYVGLIVREQRCVPSYLRPDLVIEDSAKPYSLDELFGLPARLPLKDFDVFHSPHYTLPFGLTIPSVVTIHDLIHVTHGQAWYYKYAALPQIFLAALRANVIFCVSDFTAQELTRFVPNFLIRSKISVTPNVISSRWVENSACPSSTPYLLAVLSTKKPHKGGRDLLTAWGLIAHQLDRHQLILVGDGSEGFEGERVIAKGRVTDAEYTALFRGAEALIVPSFVEGFCVPALRALFEGVPVIARPIPALKELLGAAGNFAESMSVEDLAASIYATVQFGPPVLDLEGKVSREGTVNRCGSGVVTAKVLLGYQDAVRSLRGRR